MRSLIQKAIDGEESDSPVDYAKLLRLQALDVARAGEKFAEDTISEEERADGELERLFPGD